MIIYRHGYDPDHIVTDVEVTIDDSITPPSLVVCYTSNDGVSHIEHIQSINREGDNLILFSSENW